VNSELTFQFPEKFQFSLLVQSHVLIQLSREINKIETYREAFWRGLSNVTLNKSSPSHKPYNKLEEVSLTGSSGSNIYTDMVHARSDTRSRISDWMIIPVYYRIV